MRHTERGRYRRTRLFLLTLGLQSQSGAAAHVEVEPELGARMHVMRCYFSPASWACTQRNQSRTPQPFTPVTVSRFTTRLRFTNGGAVGR